jgi:hypothetical protein
MYNHSLNNYYVVRFVLGEASLKMGTERALQNVLF